VAHALEQHKSRSVMVVSVLIEAVKDLNQELMQLPVLPTDRRPLASSSDLKSVYSSLERVISTVYKYYTFDIMHFDGSSTDYEMKRIVTAQVRWGLAKRGQTR
jgi:hypothetical protein